MKCATILSLGAALLALTCGATAQVPNADLALQIVQARQANAAKMHNYTWDCRTELVDHGKIKDTLIEQVQYGPDGKLQRVVLNDEHASLPRGFLRRAIAQSERQQVEHYIKGLRRLLDQYTLPTAGKVVDFMSSASVEFTTGPDGRRLLMIQGNGVVVPGDTLSMWADAESHQLRKVQISTIYEGSTANLTATYKTLASGGLDFMSMADVDVPAKEMTLLIHNYDYATND